MIAPRTLGLTRNHPECSPRKTARRLGRAWAVLCAVLALAILAGPLAGTAAWAETSATSKPAEIHFSFENPEVHPVHYSLRIAEDGSGEYTAVAGGPLSSDGKDSIVAPDQSRSITVGEALRTKLFLLARRNKLFAFPCQAHSKVAFNGTKTLSYSGPEGQGSCTYTWSKSKDIRELTTIIEGIALTLDEGGRLAVEREHSRLALDAELILLTKMAHQGQALELQNIAPVLTEVADDPAVLKRDQQWARELLAGDKTK